MHLCEMSRIGKSVMTEGRLVVARGWRDRRIRVTAKGCKGFLGVMKYSEGDCGDGRAVNNAKS